MSDKKKTKTRQARLPKKLIVFENADKKWHERWTENRDELNFPHPYRACCIGKPNSGKGVVVKNIVMRAKPPFEEVYLVHPDGEGTSEFDVMEPTLIDYIPAPDQFDGELKTCVVIDDLDFDGLDVEQLSNLNQLFKHVSTHKNVSVILTCHLFHPIPKQVRSCTNLWVLWKSVDGAALGRLAKKVGSNPVKLLGMFNQHVKKQHDSLWIDQTSMSPYPYRVNGFEVIERKAE